MLDYSHYLDLYNQFERACSRQRMARYLAACNGNSQRAVDLYRANIRLSSTLFQVTCLFEVILRNAIDKHYTTKFGKDWLLNQSNPGGFLATRGCEKSRKNVLDTITELGENYSHPQTIAKINFAFWRYMFGSKEFAAAGSSLLKIFPNRPSGVSQNDIYKMLHHVNATRNRIAHHDPICFCENNISTTMAHDAYKNVQQNVYWLGFDHQYLFDEIDFVLPEIERIKLI